LLRGGGIVARLLTAIACATAACATLAQTPPAQQLPPTIDPGRIQDRLDPPRVPRGAEIPELKGPQREAPDDLKALRVTLKSVRIEGASAEMAPRLQAQADGYVGREISVGEIFELARALTATYRAAGYILSQVVVPPQSLSNGVLTLRVVEGYIANVRIEGDTDAQRTLMELGEKIKASRPLHAAVLERYLLIAGDLPGIRLRSVLTPSQTPGAADLVLIVSRKSVEGFVSLDNYGSLYLGTAQLSAGLSINRLFGDDQVRILATAAGESELGYGELAYSRVLTTEGLRLGAGVSTTHTRPGDTLEPFEIRGLAQIANLWLGYPFVRTRNSSLFGRALFDYRDIDTDILGTRVVEDRIRALRFSLLSLNLDRLAGQNTLYVEASKGLNGMGATQPDDPLKSRAGASGQFFKATFDYERFQPLGANFGVTLGAAGQWTDEPLLASEQFALGGRRFGRAYDPAEIAGDRSLAARIEPVYLGRATEWLQSWQLYGFWDGGKVWYEDDPASGGQRPGESLASAGFGTRLFARRSVTATLEAAWPLTRPVASRVPEGKGDSVRILGSVVVRF
jgi:hemolysin activation/secretion protein